MTKARLLLALVFAGGMTSLAIEVCASRLLAPFFGTSLFVWGILIGLILIYLSGGYVLGGRLADRHPDPRLLFNLTAWAGLATAAIPLASRPILTLAQQGLAGYSIGLVLGSLVGVVLLFAVPVTLLGMVSPFAVRLRMEGVASAGRDSGAIFAVSTGGSILGTFVPVFWTIPTFGTRPTLLAFAAILVAISLALLWPLRRRHLLMALAIVVLVVLTPLAGVRAAAFGRLLYESDSAYNYIQVVQDGTATDLILNEGFAVHSIYDPAHLFNGGPWDLFNLGPLFHDPGLSVSPAPDRVAILGLAAGTASRQLSAIYPQVQMDGVEIDPRIVEVGRRYFAMNQPRLQVHVEDARYFMATTHIRYREVVVDAYRQPYIPFHLTTREFFTQVRSHLEPGGAVVINAGRPGSDYRLVEVLARTMASVFNQVWLVDTPEFGNTVIYAFDAPEFHVESYSRNLAVALADPGVRGELLGPLGQGIVGRTGGLRSWRDPSPTARPFTDDQAPVEQVIDQIILGYVRNSG